MSDEQYIDSGAPENTASDENDVTLNAGMEPETDQDEGLLSEGDEQDGEGEQLTQEELEELEFQGKTYKVPKDLKPGFMMQADYTRKTMEVAEERKAVAAERELVKQRAELQQKRLTEVSQVVTLDNHAKAIDARLAQYARVDWAALENQDLFKAQTAFREYQQLKDQRDNTLRQRQSLAAKIEQDIHAEREETQRERAKRIQEGHEYLSKQIPGWGPETATKLVSFAKTEGLRDEDIAAFEDNPRLVKLLHKSWLGAQATQKQRAAVARATAETTEPIRPVTPVAKGRGGPPPAGLDDRLSAEEWVKRRNQQRAKRHA